MPRHTGSGDDRQTVGFELTSRNFIRAAFAVSDSLLKIDRRSRASCGT
jgi:hypothetical protein